MPKKSVSLVMLMIISIFTFCGCGEQSYGDTKIDLSKFFGNSEGLAVFYKNGDYYTYGNDMINERKSPCSTFKIVLTLAGLKYGILRDENTLLKWDGTERYFDYWNKDLTLKEAFNLSAVWYFEKVANEVGKENLSKFVSELSYGNCENSFSCIPFFF